MRPVKFRAWDKRRKRIVLVESINFKSGVIQEDTPYAVNRKLYLDQVILMQSTGLLEKDGVEIYEGDVITEEIGEGEYLFAEVIYKDGCFLGKERNFEPEYPISDFVKGEVIGNVYQNPELLEEEEC